MSPVRLAALWTMIVLVAWPACAGLDTTAPDRTLQARGVLQIACRGDLVGALEDDGAVHLWDAASGSTLGTVGERVQAFAFAPDGQAIAGGVDGEVRVWTLPQAGTAPALRSHVSVGGRIHALDWAGSVVATSNEDGTIHTWDPSTGASRALVGSSANSVQSVHLDSRGTILVGLPSDGCDVRVWSLPSWTRLFSGPLGYGSSELMRTVYATSVTLSRDGRWGNSPAITDETPRCGSDRWTQAALVGASDAGAATETNAEMVFGAGTGSPSSIIPSMCA